MKYTLQVNLRFTDAEKTLQTSTEATLKINQISQGDWDDSKVVSLPSGDIIATLRFDEKDLAQADALYQSFIPLVKPTIENIAPMVQLHECFHDEQPPKPCRITKGVQG